MFSFLLSHCRQVTKTRKPASELNPTLGIKGEFKWNGGGTWEREKLKEVEKGEVTHEKIPRPVWVASVATCFLLELPKADRC